MTLIEELNINNGSNRFFIKRDDLMPFSFGGNKVRIANEFLEDMKKKGKNCIIGYGNARSNLSRALSNLCTSCGINCHIVSPADDDGTRHETFNSLLVKKCNVQFHECTKKNVAETVSMVIQQCVNDGFDPYYIYGSELGTGNEATPVNAYVKAYSEIKKQLSNSGTDIDYIFLATGTGMTQAGLIAGKTMQAGNEKIVGISVARNKEHEESVIKKYLDCYAQDTGYEIGYSSNDIEVDDSYLCGGYGKYDSSIEELIDKMFVSCGLPLDPVYTGKAFNGMLDYIFKKKITGKNILFIHTGGTPLFYDYLKKKRINAESPQICKCTDLNRVCDFIIGLDNYLPVPISQRTDVKSYSEKVIEYGNVLALYKDNKIIAAVLFYANDNVNKRAYITLIGTLKQFQNSGYGRLLIGNAEKTAKKLGMQFMTLETDFSNNNAISFYIGQGYNIEYADGKLHMIKELK